MLIKHGKLALSNGAIKAAANTLKALDCAPGAALPALRAGLRHDAPAALVFPSVGAAPEIHLDAPLTWYLSDVGGGASQVMYALAKNAALNGWRIIRTATTNEHAANWHPDDVRPSVFTFPKDSEDNAESCGANELWGQLDDAFNGPETAFEFIIPYDRVSTYQERFLSLGEKMPEGTLLILRHWYDESTNIREIADQLRILAKEKNCQVVLHIEGHSCEDPRLGIRRSDGLILGKSAIQPSHIELYLDCYREGDCAIRTPNGFVETTGPYLDININREHLFGEDFRGIISDMEAAIEVHRPARHIDRLELVSRCCGYRNWQAAQGRREKAKTGVLKGTGPDYRFDGHLFEIVFNAMVHHYNVLIITRNGVHEESVATALLRGCPISSDVLVAHFAQPAHLPKARWVHRRELNSPDAIEAAMKPHQQWTVAHIGEGARAASFLKNAMRYGPNILGVHASGLDEAFDKMAQTYCAYENKSLSVNEARQRIQQSFNLVIEVDSSAAVTLYKRAPKDTLFKPTQTGTVRELMKGVMGKPRPEEFSKKLREWNSTEFEKSLRWFTSRKGSILLACGVLIDTDPFFDRLKAMVSENPSASAGRGAQKYTFAQEIPWGKSIVRVVEKALDNPVVLRVHGDDASNILGLMKEHLREHAPDMPEARIQCVDEAFDLIIIHNSEKDVWEVHRRGHSDILTVESLIGDV